MTRPERSDRIEDYAGKLRGLVFPDRDRPLTAGALASMMGLSSDPKGQSVVRQAARALNFAGVPIVADERGFWMATTPGEVRVYMDREIGSRRVALAQRESALGAIVAQMERPSGTKPSQGLLFDMPDDRPDEDE